MNKKAFIDTIKELFSFCRKKLIISLIFGFLIGLSFVLGYQLEKYGMTLPGFSGKGKIFLLSLLIMIPAGLVTYVCLGITEKYPVEKPGSVRPKRVFFMSFIFLMGFRIPIFLAYYPAVMSYDFGRQLSEAVNGHKYFWDYQPLIHTELIRIFYLIGQKIGNLQVGMALLSIFQFTVLSLILAYSVSVIYRVTGRLWISVTLTAIYSLLPVHTLISVIMTKDVLFSAFMLLFICLIYERSLKKTILIDVALVLTAVLNITFRKNSVYAMVVLIIGFLLYEKTLKEKLLSALLIVVCIGSGIGVQNAMIYGFDVIRGNNSEMYSVPMVQFMRVYENQTENLTDEQYDMIYKVLPLEIDGLSYNPYFADTVKNFTDYRDDIWSGSPKAFSKEWLALAKAYPNDFIDAFLSLNRGYWYLPDRVFAEVLGVGADVGKGVLHTYNCTYGIIDGGIENVDLCPIAKRFIEKSINENGFFKWPILNILFRPAFYFILLMFTTFAALYKKKRIGFIMITYPLLYMGTLFFGPLVYFRYIYPIILTVPVLIAVVLFDKVKE